MNRTCAVFAAVCFLSLSFATKSARADIDIDITAGETVAAPTGIGDAFVGSRIALGGRWVFAEHHALGLQGRVYFFSIPWSSHALNAAASYRYFMKLREHVDLFGGLSAGAGVWRGCVRGDYCGGVGPTFGVEVGVQAPVSEYTAVTFGAEIVAQLGMVNDVNAMVMPTAWVGIAF